MFKRLRNWFNRRRIQEERARFNEGYMWAEDNLVAGLATVASIEAASLGSFDAFDLGAIKAAYEWEAEQNVPFEDLIDFDPDTEEDMHL